MLNTRMRLVTHVPTADNTAPSYEALAARRRAEPANPQREEADALRPARGVFFAALLGAGLWLGILYCTWIIVR